MERPMQHSDNEGPRWWIKPLISGITSGTTRAVIDWLFSL